LWAALLLEFFSLFGFDSHVDEPLKHIFPCGIQPVRAIYYSLPYALAVFLNPVVKNRQTRFLALLLEIYVVL
jgi:hypothetical protein